MGFRVLLNIKFDVSSWCEFKVIIEAREGKNTLKCKQGK